MPGVAPQTVASCVLILTSRGMTRWQHICLQSICQDFEIAIGGVILAHEGPQARGSWRPANAVRRMLDAATRPRLALRVGIADDLNAIAQRRVATDTAGRRLILSASDVDWISARQPDFVLSLDALPEPHLPALAPLGTWAFAIGDPPLLSESRPGVREIGRRNRRLGLAIQQVASRETPALTLAVGHTPVIPYSRKRSLARLYDIAPDLLGMAVRDRRAGQTRSVDQTPHPSVASGQASWAVFLGAIVRESLIRWTEKLLYRQQWRIGLMEGNALIPSTRTIENARWLANPTGVFQADPCFMPRDARRLLVEEYSHASGRGRITALSGDSARNQAPSNPHSVLETDGHLSFPRVYRRGNHLWLVPEMADQGRQYAYALDHDAGLLDQPPVTLEGLQGIDPVLFEHNGHHWALLSPAGRRANYQLDLFHADHFLGPYRPHPANPIRIDPRGGRNAGPVITRDGRLYRFGQVFGRLYGEAIDVFEITTLDQYAYADNHIGRIQPADAGRSGMHSIDFADNTTVVDRFYLEPRWAGWRDRCWRS